MYPLAAVLLWGGNAIVAKASAHLIDAIHINFYRWLLASLLLMPFVLRAAVQYRKLLIARLPRLAVLGALGGALFPWLMYQAAQDTTAFNIGIIQALTPLFALAFGQIWMRSAIAIKPVIGLSIALVGVILVVSRGDPAAMLSHSPNIGDALMVAATGCFALYSVLLERWRSDLPASLELFVQSAFSVVLLAPAFVLSPCQPIAAAAVPLILYAALLGSVAAPLLWMAGVARLGPERATVFFNMLPIVTAALAVIILGEPLYWSMLTGGLLVVVGVVLAEKSAKRA